MVDRRKVPAGWNDPPKLSYSDVPSRTPVKGLFNQRVAFPNDPSQQPAVYGAPLYQSHSDQQVANGGIYYQPTATNHSGFFTPTPAGFNGDPPTTTTPQMSPGLHHSYSVPNGLLNFPSVHHHNGGDQLTPAQKIGSHPHLLDVNGSTNDDATTIPPSIGEDLPDDVIVDIFKSALEGSKLHDVQRSNVKRRLESLTQSLMANSLSVGCKGLLQRLVRAFVDKKYDVAYQIHTAMMLDFFEEAKSWLVGIKALILDCKQHV